MFWSNLQKKSTIKPHWISQPTCFTVLKEYAKCSYFEWYGKTITQDENVQLATNIIKIKNAINNTFECET